MYPNSHLTNLGNGNDKVWGLFDINQYLFTKKNPSDENEGCCEPLNLKIGYQPAPFPNPLSLFLLFGSVYPISIIPQTKGARNRSRLEKWADTL